MKASIDADSCTACGLCCDECPSVFVMGDDVAEVKGDVVPPADEEACKEAAASCPMECITIVE